MAAIAFGASDASQYHDDYFAVSDTAAAWWPGETNVAGPYEIGSWYALDFREAVNSESFTLIADPATTPTASCAVYRSDDAIVWFGLFPPSASVVRDDSPPSTDSSLSLIHI